MELLKVQKKTYWKVLGMMLLISVLIAGISYYYLADILRVEQMLKTAHFAIPTFAFILFWLLFYFLSGVASYRLYCHLSHEANTKKEKEKIRHCLYWYALLMIGYAIWLPVLFRFQLVGWSIALLVAILILTSKIWYRLRKIDKTAATLYLPMFLWEGYLLFLQTMI